MSTRSAIIGWSCVLAAFAGCAGSRAPSIPDTPEEAIETISRGVADARPEVLWQALPPSYQKDLSTILHDMAATSDPEVWNRSFAVLGKLTRVLDEKRAFILEHPMVASQVKDRAHAEAVWDGVVGMFRILLESELADHEKAKNLDIEQFLAGTGARLMKHVAEASTLVDPKGKGLASLAQMEASVVSTAGDTARVRVTRPGCAPVEEDYVRVEGRWIPKTLADAWPASMARMREQLAAVSAADSAATKATALMQLQMVEGILDRVLATRTKEEFQASIEAAVGMAISAAMQQGMRQAQATTPPPAPAAPEPDPMTAAQHEDLVSLLVGPADDGLPAGAAGEGAVRVTDAGRYVGRSLHVVGRDGLDFTGTLTSASPTVLVFERELGGGAGTMTFEVSPRDVSSLSAGAR